MKDDQFIAQIGRLFSSKNNRGKQVHKLTDRFHTIKQVLIAASIVLLIGHSNFRDHFKCQGKGAVDSKITTNFCLINGTTTIEDSDQQQWSETHIGLGWKPGANEQRVINHSYIRSLWALLILIGACSYFPQRKWASIFQNDTLQALLQLSGYKESKLVCAAENARPYEMLSRMERKLSLEQIQQNLEQNKDKSRSERVAHLIAIVDDHSNIYNHQLDYYPNQLIYLLLTNNSRAYKSSDLKLRGKLIWYSLWSTSFTVMQFLLPITFVGLEYKSYGWKYTGLLWNYLCETAKQVKASRPLSYMNTIDYSLSAKIFPTQTACEYHEHAYTGDVDKIIVLCHVAINEICAKLFVVIWWTVVVNIFVELWSLLIVIIGSLNFKLTSYIFAWCYWPAAREQAEAIASFRFRRQLLLDQLRQKTKTHRRLDLDHLDLERKSSAEAERGAGDQATASSNELSARDKKRLEAEGQKSAKRVCYESDSDDYYDDKSIILSCVRSLASKSVALVGSLACCLVSRRREHFEREDEKDINIFYLLYLIYLRLDNSRNKAEEVIQMTSVALDNYLMDLGTNSEWAEMANFEDELGPESKAEQQKSSEDRKRSNKALLSKEGTTIVDVMM